MSSQIISTNELIERAGRLFTLKGYFHTSIADVASYCGLKKASVYHHVKSKKDLGIKVLQKFHQDVDAKIFSIARDTQLDRNVRFERFVEAICHYFSEKEGGCLAGNFSLEAGNLDADFRALCQSYFDDFKKAFVSLLDDREDSEKLADDFIAIIQGYIMAAQVRNDATIINTIPSRMNVMLKSEAILG